MAIKNKQTVITVPIGRPLAGTLDVIFAAGLTPMLAGGTGVGKSTQLEDYAAHKKWGFRTRDLSLMEPPDLIGLPKPDGKVTRYLPPSFLPTEADGDGLLALEEINRAPAYMQAPCLQLLTARCLNDYTLPRDWRIAAAINPVEDGYAADELDPALTSRFVRVNVVACPDEWADWARIHGVDGRVIEYVLSDPSVFDSPASNPRAWTAVAKLLEQGEKLGTASGLLHAAVAGSVGTERAAAFLRYIKDRIKPLDADQVLKGYTKARPILTGWVADGKLDLVQGTLLKVKQRLQSQTEYAAARTRSNVWKNLGKLLNDLPGDLREDAEAFFRERAYDVPNATGRAK